MGCSGAQQGSGPGQGSAAGTTAGHQWWVSWPTGASHMQNDSAQEGHRRPGCAAASTQLRGFAGTSSLPAPPCLWRHSGCWHLRTLLARNWQPSLERVTWSRNAAAMFFSLSRGVCPSLLLSGAPHVLVFCHYPHSPVPSNPVSYKGKTNGVFFTKHKKLPNLFFYGGRRTGRRICIAPALVTEDYHY